MKTALFLLLSLSFALLSCVSDDKEDDAAENIVVGEGSVVVSFKNPSDIDARHHFFMAKKNDSTWIGKMNLAILFFDDTEAYMKYLPDKPDLIFDTLTVVPAKDFSIFRHFVNYFDVNEYILQKGDSVQVEYMINGPRLTFQNRKTLKFDTNFDSLASASLKRDRYSPLGKYLGVYALSMASYFSDKNMLNKDKGLTFKQKNDEKLRSMARFRNELYPESKDYLSNENRLLDSLKSFKEISTVPYYFYKERNKYLGHLLDLQTDHLDKPQITAILKAHQLNRFGYPEVYYQQFLEAVSQQYIEEKVDLVDNNKPSPPNYKQSFDQIDTSALFPEKDRNYLLTKEIKRIQGTFSHDDFIAYFKKYETKVNDTSLVNSVRNDFALEFDDRRSETASVVLTDLGGKKLTFEDVKARHNGKVIYVDFWASWCGPCRGAMPASADLRKALKGKDVVFVYLSIDGSITPWKKASTAEKLANYSENYLIVNAKTSDFLKQNKLSSIPRYMIFDKTGRLTHANAPRVESGGVGLLLTTLADKP